MARPAAAGTGPLRAGDRAEGGASRPAPPPRPDRSTDVASWCMVGGMAAVCLLVCRHLGFHVDARRAILPAAGVAALGAAMLLGGVLGRPRLRAAAAAFLQMTLFTIVAVMLSYAFAAGAGPLWDGALAAADRRLGLDWPALFRQADRAPAGLWIGAVAYYSLTVQMIVCIVVLSAAGRTDTLRTAVAAAIASGFATVAISGAMPAMGNLFDPGDYRALWPSVAWTERGLIAGLRDGSRRTLDLTQLMGIVSFPSYHAALPVILAWAQRDVPRWRVVAPVWAALTILATPLFGGHYGVDVLAGLGLAALALAVAPRLVRRRRPGGIHAGAPSGRPAADGSTRVSLLASAAIGGAWLAIHVGGILFWRWSAAGVPLALLLILVQAWLSTGLFIVAHDCMHGSLAPGRRGLNTIVGTLCLAGYAGLSYRELYPKHHAHHRAPGTDRDPDFHAAAPRRAWPWFVRFFRGYYTHGQILRITAAAAAYMLLGASLANIVAFWAVPALIALAQLFLFGTYLPHRHGEAPFADAHNARSNGLPPLASLVTCFHFGAYHHEHHLSPDTPWWRLPRVRLAPPEPR